LTWNPFVSQLGFSILLNKIYVSLQFKKLINKKHYQDNK